MSAAPSSRPRVAWVDAGRGLAITLVVLFHSTNWLGEAGLDVEVLSRFNEGISSMRLPLFFTMAGMFAVRWATSPWGDVWRVKLSLFAWVYLVWSVIATFSFMLGLNIQGARGNYFAQLRELAWAPVSPRFELWFIWALALFFVIARLTVRVPGWILLGVSGGLAVVALSGLLGAVPGWSGAAKYLFFFLAGMILRGRILRTASAARPLAASAAVLAWGVLAVGGAAAGWNGVPGFAFVSCIAGVLAGVSVSRALGGIRALRFLGARTLPVYLTHTTVILGLTWLLWRVGVVAAAGSAAAVLLPLAVAVTSIVVSLSLSWLSQSVRAIAPLYAAPEWFRRGGRRNEASAALPSADSPAADGARRDVA